MVFEEMPELRGADNAVKVAPAEFLDLHHPRGLSVGENAMHRALGDAHQARLRRPPAFGITRLESGIPCSWCGEPRNTAAWPARTPNPNRAPTGQKPAPASVRSAIPRGKRDLC